MIKLTKHLHDAEGGRLSSTVCGVTRAASVTPSIPDLLRDREPCPRCLKWVIEQGQLATQKLDSINGEEPHDHQAESENL